MLKHIEQFEIRMASGAKQIKYDSLEYAEPGGPWIRAHAITRYREDFGSLT